LATGCRDEQAARNRLAEWEKTAERVRGGISTTAEERTADLRPTALAGHIADYLTALEAAGVTPAHRANVRRFLDRLATECGFERLADLDRGPLVRWLAERAAANMGARTRNAYRNAAFTFGRWAVRTGRLTANPFADMPKADERSDPRRQRRSLTEAELRRLLDVAARRPLDDARTVRRGERSGQQAAELRAETVERLQLLGRERALIYKALVLTGLRKGELSSLTVSQLHLDGPAPFAALDAADEKNREGNDIPLRADLAADLLGWLTDKLHRTQEATRLTLQPVPLRLAPTTAVFDVPAGLLRILNRDLTAAGIAKRDDRGRVIDVHAMRTTFGTLLSKGGVSLRTAQAAMRHSDPSLTANVYTDPRLLDVGAALDALPALPLPGSSRESEIVRATGTDCRTVAPTVAPARGHSSASPSIPDTMAANPDRGGKCQRFDVMSCAGNKKNPLSSTDSGLSRIGPAGFEPTTSCTPNGPDSVCQRTEKLDTQWSLSR
jgi:integrase